MRRTHVGTESADVQHEPEVPTGQEHVRLVVELGAAELAVRAIGGVAGEGVVVRRALGRRGTRGVGAERRPVAADLARVRGPVHEHGVDDVAERGQHFVHGRRPRDRLGARNGARGSDHRQRKPQAPAVGHHN